ncbi:MAG: hypothetical protein NMNS01_24810 [Nitrosomonas sp.]|nr:MAG: hypothetical protein NMNS01_24810 [Nitrosomonas sp.]
MIEALRDPAWNGIAGMAAVLSLLLIILDVRSTKFRDWATSIGILLKQFIKALAFSSYGLTYGLIGMVCTAPVSMFINFFAADSGRFPGGFGDFLLALSEVRILMWGFNTELTTLDLQLGALGLWGGAIIGFFAMMRFGASVNYNYSYISRYHHYLAFLVGLIGALNLGKKLLLS